MSSSPSPSPFHLPSSTPKTVIVTGAASGIGAQTLLTYYSHGCNVVIADLPQSSSAAQFLLSSLPDLSRALFHPTDVTSWTDMQSLFRKVKEKFGQVDIVVANAGMMESRGFFDFDEDENGELVEDEGVGRVLDVNLKGSMHTLRLAMHAMSSNPPDTTSSRGSIILIASTSGYFGGTGVVSYISSKHGVVGLARASQRVANRLGIRVNVVAPFFTPTNITQGYAEKWKEQGLPANTVEDVAKAVVETSLDPEMRGCSMMVAGSIRREIEMPRTALMKEWLGEGIADVMAKGGKFFEEQGGYTLPKARS